MFKVKVGVIGSTGSVGRQVLSVLSRHLEKYEVVLLACKNSYDLIKQQAKQFKVNDVIINCDEKLANPNTYKNCDVVCNAISDLSGLLPTLAIIQSKAQLITANKESLVLYGHRLNKICLENNKNIIPLDSEHSAILQCLEENNNIHKLILTASGGAFRNFSKEEIKGKKAIEALQHPVWKMGNKITIDSATLMNKGLEIIEARHLFNCLNIEVLIHKESIIHSIVEFEDSFQKSVMSLPNMELPIQYALSYPYRLEKTGERLKLEDIGKLTFKLPDYNKFPCLKIAKDVLKLDSDLSASIMCLSNSEAVRLYLEDKISFYEINKIISVCIEKFNHGSIENPSDIFQLNNEIKSYINSIAGGNL